MCCPACTNPARVSVPLPVEPLFDRESKDVTVVGYWLAFPAHTNYLVVETDDIGHLHNFLLPGAGRTVCEITPVSDKPMPKPD